MAKIRETAEIPRHERLSGVVDLSFEHDDLLGKRPKSSSKPTLCDNSQPNGRKRLKDMWDSL